MTAPGTLDVTVVIPSRDRHALVARSVSTAGAQVGDFSFEILVVDDGSQVPVDASALEPLRGRAVGCRVVRHDRSRGVAEARNRGIAEARGRFIAFLDDDDLWAPDKLARQLAAMHADGSRWCHTGAFLAHDDLVVWLEINRSPAPTTVERMLEHNQVGTPSSVMVAKALLDRAGGFDPSFSVLADWELWLRLAAIEPATVIPEPLIGYITHDASMHRQLLRPIFEELSRLGRKHRALGKLDTELVWRWIGNTARDTGRRHWAVLIFLVSGVRSGNLRTILAAPRCLIPYRRRLPQPDTPEWIACWREPARA